MALMRVGLMVTWKAGMMVEMKGYWSDVMMAVYLVCYLVVWMVSWMVEM